MSDPLAAAVEAAEAAGRVIVSSPPPDAERKGAGDYVTEVDRECERTIERILTGATGTPVVGEESIATGQRGERYWIVDPLDGTTNFLHGFPAVGVSIALVDAGHPVIGVVHAPFLGATYRAMRGAGAEVTTDRGTSRLTVSSRPTERAILATGFPFRRKELLPLHLRVAEACLRSFEDLRRPGAASLDLAWVAEGVFEGFFELNLSAWDVAAGALLVEEAGGRVSDWSGGPDYLSGDILAATPQVHARLLEITKGEPG